MSDDPANPLGRHDLSPQLFDLDARLDSATAIHFSGHVPGTYELDLVGCLDGQDRRENFANQRIRPVGRDSTLLFLQGRHDPFAGLI